MAAAVLDSAAGRTAHHTASVVVVVGETGSGKTTLITQAVSELHGYAAVWTSGDRATAGTPLGLVARLGTALHRLAGGRRPYGGPEHPAEHLVELVSQLQRDRPVVVVVDDLQWADDRSLDVLGELTTALSATRFLLVLAGSSHRTAAISGSAPAAGWERFPAELEARGLTVRLVRVPPLNDVQLHDLAHHLHGTVPEPALVERLVRFSRGNARVARTLADAAFTDVRTSGNAVPPSLLAATNRLLAPLSPTARRLLEAVAVLGGQAPLTLATQVAEADDYLDALTVLLDEELLSWSPADAPVTVTIHDPLLRSAVYQLLSPRQRQVLHTATAQWVHGEERWRHRAAAAVGVDAHLASELEHEAISTLDDGFAYAVKCLRWAGDLSADKAQHDRRLLTAAVLDLWWRADADGEEYRTVIAAAMPSAYRSCALGLLLARRPDHLRDAAAAVQSCLDEPGGLERFPQRLALLPRCVLAHIHIARSAGHTALLHAQAVVDNATSATHPAIVVRAARALLLATFFLHGGEKALATAASLENTVVARLGLGDQETLFDFEKSLFHLSGGHVTRALTLASRALDTGTDPANDSSHRLALLVLMECRRLRGDWKAARETAEVALSATDHPLPPSAMGSAHLLAILLAADTGSWARVEQLTGRLRRIRVESEDHRRLYLAVARAAVSRAKGLHEEIVSSVDSVWPLLDGTGRLDIAVVYEGVWRPLLVEGLIEGGATERARAELRLLAELAEQRPYLQMTVLWLSGRLAQRTGDQAAARKSCERAVALPPGPDEEPLSRAMAELAYGRALLDGRQRAKAVLWLESARKHFLRLGAAPYAARCQQLLGTTTPEPEPQVGHLTDRERAVVELVSSGHTNGEVAARLFVSEKTVEYHLSNVFTKLGISSRRQLRRVAMENLGRRNHRRPSSGG